MFSSPGLAAFEIKLKKYKGIRFPLSNLIPLTMNSQLILPTSASHDLYAGISSMPPTPSSNAHCPFIHTASCFRSPFTVVLHCWLKCLCFRRRRADDRAPLSAPKNLTRAHNRKTSQVRVSGIVRGTFADRLPTCNKIRAYWCSSQQQKLKKYMAIKGPSTHSFLCIPPIPLHLFVCLSVTQQVQPLARHNIDPSLPPPTSSIPLFPQHPHSVSDIEQYRHFEKMPLAPGKLSTSSCLVLKSWALSLVAVTYYWRPRRTSMVKPLNCNTT